MGECLIKSEQPEPTSSYKKCYVAFMDILGYKNFVNTGVFNDILETATRFDWNALSNLLGLKPQFEIDVKAVDVLCISDSIIMSVEEEVPHALEAIIWLCGASQLQLLMNTGLLIRGGISHGDFYIGKSRVTGNLILFGPAYNQAVCLEKPSETISPTDNPPRVVLDETIVKDFDILTQTCFLEKDSDGKIFVDYLRHIPCEKLASDASKVKAKERIVEQVKNQIRKHHNAPSIKEKYIWTKKYITEFFAGEELFPE